MSTKDDVNIKLRQQGQSAGKTKQEYKVITIRGVDEEGFSYTEKKRVPVESSEGAGYQDKAVTAQEGNYAKQATKVGQTAGEVNGGVLSVDEPNEEGEVILNESIGEITDDVGLDGLIDPTTNLNYGPGIPSFNYFEIDSNGVQQFSNLDSADSITAEKVGGDSAQPLSDILNSLTGMGTALTNLNSGLAVVGAGGISGVQAGIDAGVAGANQLVSDVKDAVANVGSVADVGQMANVAQDAAMNAINDVASNITSIPTFAPGASLNSVTPDSVLEQVNNISGFGALSALKTAAKNTLSKFPSVASFMDKAKDLVSDVQSLSDSITNFNTNITTQINEGLSDAGGILQDIGEGITGKAKGTISGLAGSAAPFNKEKTKELVGKTKGSVSEQASVVQETVAVNPTVTPRMQEVVSEVETTETTQELSNQVQDKAAEKGIPPEEVSATVEVIERADEEVQSLDTTISGTNVVDASFFEESKPIDASTQKWSGRDTKDDAFTYVSSVEELEAEIRSIERTLQSVVIHATETTTDKNIGAIEINNIQKDLGLDGIGYHYVIRRDGRLQRGRPINKKGEHLASLDATSIGVVLVGGLNCSSGEANPTMYMSSQSFTMIQYNTLEKILQAFYRRYPGGLVFGHNDLDEDEFDPYFDVEDYIEATFRKTNG
jgi:N-acetylmuramoyl-L-alanine amidase